MWPSDGWQHLVTLKEPGVGLTEGVAVPLHLRRFQQTMKKRENPNSQYVQRGIDETITKCQLLKIEIFLFLFYPRYRSWFWIVCTSKWWGCLKAFGLIQRTKCGFLDLRLLIRAMIATLNWVPEVAGRLNVVRRGLPSGKSSFTIGCEHWYMDWERPRTSKSLFFSRKPLTL